MALPSDWTDWAQATTWVGSDAIPSEWTDWAEATTWESSDAAPSEWTDWLGARTWTASADAPSAWTDWAEAATSLPQSIGWRRAGAGWVELGASFRLELSGWRALLTQRPPDPDPDPPTQDVWWSHYDQQSRAGTVPDSNPAFDAFESAMKNRMADPPQGPIGSFIRGYSGANFPSTFQSSAVSSAPSRGVGAMLNVKRPDWAALANGDYDSTITSFFNSWPVETFGSFTINHEPENDQPSGPANISSAEYRTWASVNGPLWSQGIARTIAVAAPIIRARGLDVKLGGCLMDFSWDTVAGAPYDGVHRRWEYWDWWNYVDPQYLDVVEFQIDAYSKTVAGPPPYGHDLMPRIQECLSHGRAVGIEHWSLFETAIDRRERHGGDNMVGTDESVAAWWEDFRVQVEAEPGARMMGYFSIPTGPASGQAGIMGRGLDVFADICLNGRRP